MTLEQTTPKENLRAMYPLTERLKKVDIETGLNSSEMVTVGKDGVHNLNQALQKLFPDDIPNKKDLFAAVLARAVDRGFNVNLLLNGDAVGVMNGFLKVKAKDAPKAWLIPLSDSTSTYSDATAETFDPRSRVVAKTRRAWESIREADDTYILNDAMESRGIKSTRANREELWEILKAENRSAADTMLNELRKTLFSETKDNRLQSAPDDFLESEYAERADHLHFLAILAYLRMRYPSGTIEREGLEPTARAKKERERRRRKPADAEPAAEQKPEGQKQGAPKKEAPSAGRPAPEAVKIPKEKIAEINDVLKEIDPSLSLLQPTRWPLKMQKMDGTLARDFDPAQFVLIKFTCLKSTIREVTRTKPGAVKFEDMEIVRDFYIPYSRKDIEANEAYIPFVKQTIREIKDYAQHGGNGMKRPDGTTVSNRYLMNRAYYGGQPQADAVPAVGPESVQSLGEELQRNELLAELKGISPNLELVPDASILGTFGVITPNLGPQKYTPPKGFAMLRLRVEDSTLIDPLGEHQAAQAGKAMPPTEKDFYFPYDPVDPPTRQYLIELVRKTESWAHNKDVARPAQVLLVTKHPEQLTTEAPKLADIQKHAKDIVPQLTAIMERGGWTMSGLFLTDEKPSISFEDRSDPNIAVTIDLVPGPDGKRTIRFVDGRSDALEELTRVHEEALKDLDSVVEQIKEIKSHYAARNVQKGWREVAEKGTATKKELLAQLHEFGTRIEGRAQVIGGKNVDHFSIDPGDGRPVEVAVFILPVEENNPAGPHQYRCVVLDGQTKIADFLAPRAQLAKAMVIEKTLTARREKK